MEFMKSYVPNEKIHIKCWLDDSIFMYSYLCCLFIYARELWTLAKRFAMQFLLPYFVYMLSVINITFDIYIIL